jgi:hypothetical protein
MGLISLIGLARQGTVPPDSRSGLQTSYSPSSEPSSWCVLERPGDRDWIGSIRGWLLRRMAGLRGKLAAGPGAAVPSVSAFPLLPQLVDTYVLNSFLYYLVLLLISFVLMIHIFTFFELLSDIVKNRIPMWQVFEYLLFLTPKLIYDTTPISVLVAVLITFGVFTKHNEDHGVQSLRRQPLPPRCSGPPDEHHPERGPVCVRSLLHP